jgi:hypothetical protein
MKNALSAEIGKLALILGFLESLVQGSIPPSPPEVGLDFR